MNKTPSIIDPSGRRLRNRNKTALLVVMVSDDEKGPFKAIDKKDVPEWVKDPEVMGRLVNGEMCRQDGPWFLAVRVDETGKVIH